MDKNYQDLLDLKAIVGGWAFRALINGRPLQIWRRSSPHNWFIEDAKKTGYLWHSEPHEFVPSLQLFDNTYNSYNKILHYWGADSGSSQLSCYVLKPGLRRLYNKITIQHNERR